MKHGICRFTVSNQLIEKEPELLSTLMAGMVVLRAERLWERDRTEYLVTHPSFGESQPGMAAREVEWELSKREDGIDYLLKDGDEVLIGGSYEI